MFSLSGRNTSSVMRSAISKWLAFLPLNDICSCPSAAPFQRPPATHYESESLLPSSQTNQPTILSYTALPGNKTPPYSYCGACHHSYLLARYVCRISTFCHHPPRMKWTFVFTCTVFMCTTAVDLIRFQLHLAQCGCRRKETKYFLRQAERAHGFLERGAK